MNAKKLGVAVLVAAGVGAAYADATWQGAQYDLNADWSLSANWNGDVPTGDAIATITYLEGSTDKRCTLGLTPPLDFTGSINVTYDTTSWNTSYHNTLRLNVLDGATWSVTGNGMVYASEALAPRIASTFTGVIVVTNGASFTVPIALANSVEFVGDGRLVVSEARRLTHLSGFTGTLVWAGDAALAPSDTSLVQLRKVELANGAALNYGERTLSANPALKIKDWNESPSDWTFGGTSGTHDVLDFDTRLAHPNEDGSLALITDPKQNHTAIFSGYKLKMHDNWGVSFHYEPSMPADSAVGRAGWTSTWAGAFGFFMMPSLETTDATRYLPSGKYAHGFQTYLYQDSSHAPYLGWVRGTDISAGARWLQTNLDAVNGPNLRQAMDVTMASQDGLITVTLRQGDKYFVMMRSSANQYTIRDVSDGFYLAFAAASDWWDSSDTSHNVPWSKHTISNFKGWYRAREAGRWTADSRSFYPFTTANCAARRYTAESTYTASADALEEDGSFKVESNGERLETIIRSSLALDRRKRHLVSYDLVYGDGTNAENTERFKFGFTRSTDGLSSWLYRWDASHNDIKAEKWNNYVYPYFITLYWYGGQAYFFTTKPTDKDGNATSYSSAKFSYPKTLKNQTAHTSLVYDGGRTLYYQVHSAQHVTDVSWAPSVESVDYSTSGWGSNVNNMFFLMSSQNTWGQVDTWLKNFTVKTLSDNQTVFHSGELAVAAGATATFNAEPLVVTSASDVSMLGRVSLGADSTLNVTGGKTVIESVRVTGSGATLAATTAVTLGDSIVYEGVIPSEGLTLGENVTLAQDELTFTIPDAWRKDRNDHTILKTSTLPTTVRIVTASGRDITKRCTIDIMDGAVTVSFARGFVLFLE